MNILKQVLEIPKGYICTYFLDELVDGGVGCIEVFINYAIKKGNRLHIEAYSKKFNKIIEIIIFNASYFHTSLFKAKKDIILYAKIQIQGSIKIINPKIPKEVNKIIPIYGKQVNIIPLKELEKTNLPRQILKSLEEIFNPSLEFFNEYIKLKALPEKNLYALKFVEAFYYTKRLSRIKTSFKSKFILDNNIDEFIKSLPFTLTKDQAKALKDIKSDLKSNIAQRRIIMGDVGSGKTILILASALICYPKKSILMTPTTILAYQIFNEAKKLLPSYVRIGLLTSKNSKKLDLDSIDFLIGTQALLYQEFNMQSYGLVMSDEQHRFGSKERHMLEKLISSSNQRPHNLQFSATPIPRTMAMLKGKFVNFSFIKQTPFEKNISTQIISNADFKNLLTHIKQEVSKNFKAIIIYPLVQKSEKISYAPLEEALGFWQKHFSHVYLTHGKHKQKEDVLLEFKECKKGAILLATTMVEVGISLSDLTIIVIVGAERLGLASLHQLRGRVSRNGLQGFCYLFTKSPNNQRLIEFCKTNSGFKIAELDLKYRNSGDLLDGEEQSGENFRYLNLLTDEAILQEVANLIAG